MCENQRELRIPHRYVFEAKVGIPLSNQPLVHLGGLGQIAATRTFVLFTDVGEQSRVFSNTARVSIWNFMRHVSAVSADRRRYVGPCLVLLLLVISIWSFTLVRAQAQSSGLTAGQWARYTISGELSEGVTSSLFTVVSVQGTVVQVSSLDTYWNGSSAPDDFSIDLVSGQGNVHLGLYLAILPSKTVGDPVYQGSDIIISERRFGVYAEASRQVNFARNSNDTAGVDYYWDVDTGIFTEIVMRYGDTAGPTRLGVQARMTATNIWEPDSPNDTGLLYTAAVTVTSSILLAAVLIGRYARKRPGKK